MSSKVVSLEDRRSADNSYYYYLSDYVSVRVLLELLLWAGPVSALPFLYFTATNDLLSFGVCGAVGFSWGIKKLIKGYERPLDFIPAVVDHVPRRPSIARRGLKKAA